MPHGINPICCSWLLCTVLSFAFSHRMLMCDQYQPSFHFFSLDIVGSCKTILPTITHFPYPFIVLSILSCTIYTSLTAGRKALFGSRGIVYSSTRKAGSRPDTLSGSFHLRSLASIRMHEHVGHRASKSKAQWRITHPVSSNYWLIKSAESL